MGLGLIGGSLGMAIKKTRPEVNICGVDINHNTIQIGINTKCIDWGTLDIVEGVRNADLVIIATLVSKITKIALEIEPYLKTGCIVTDVGSTKVEITKSLNKIFNSQKVYYVGGHPMAGAETKGIEGADPFLFENAIYVLTPTEFTNKEALFILEDLIGSLGANIIHLSPADHDFMVAAISHLPHVIAASLVNTVGLMEEEKAGILKLAAGGFKDLTRIADSQPEMWQDIFLQNRNRVLSSIKVFKKVLEDIEESIYNKDEKNIYSFFKKAQEQRSKITRRVKSILPEIFEVIVTVPDKPGVIGSLANLLGKENININDIEILRVREGDEGTIRFGFNEFESAKKAVQIFCIKGYTAKLKK